ncbi:hypothetical protein DV738_g1374, partial [Chaetothyriales sp. CBS 135597]
MVKAGILLSRPPLLTPDTHPFEAAYHLYQRRLNERLVLPFTQYLYYKRGTPTWHDEVLVGDESGSDQRVLELLVDEEGRGAEFTPRGGNVKTGGLTRVTAADQRKGWELPSGPLLPLHQGKEGLREAARRVLAETCGPNMNTWFVGAHPARIFAGQANVQQAANPAYQDFQWLTKEEIKAVVDPAYWSRIQDMLVAQ